MKITREQIYGIGGSLLLCLAIEALLTFLFLQTPTQGITEGIPVEYGSIEWTEGMFEPQKREIPEEIETEASSVPALLTQNIEQTAVVESPQEKAKKARQAAKKKKREEEKQRKKAISKQMSNVFGTSAQQSSQGSPTGNSTSGAASDIGGIGFSLDGRSVRGGILPRPAYAGQEEGNIVVEITVNPQGQVTQATIRLRGTNIDNTNMRRSAMNAARQTTFNAIDGTQQNQIGTITYRYILK